MTDLTRTKCGRIQNQEKDMLNNEMLTCYFRAGYKNPFSPVVRKSSGFAQNSMGCHSEVFTVTRYRTSSGKKAA